MFAGAPTPWVPYPTPSFDPSPCKRDPRDLASFAAAPYGRIVIGDGGQKDFPMGRFASTVALYEHFRPPYPPDFFHTVAEKLKLSKQHALIDLGTGPGLLAIGFAPYVGSVTGV